MLEVYAKIFIVVQTDFQNRAIQKKETKKKIKWNKKAHKKISKKEKKQKRCHTEMV